MTERKMDFSRSTSLLNIERIRDALRKEDLLTAPELADRVYLCVEHIRNYLKYMVEQELVHHPRWTREAVAGLRPFPRAQYRLGPGVNRPKPTRLTSAQVQRRLRRRLKQDPDNNEHLVRTSHLQRTRRALRSRHERLVKLREQGYPPELVYASGSALRVGLQRRSPRPEQVADVIRLRDEGKTWSEIAAETGVARSTARTYYLRIVDPD